MVGLSVIAVVGVVLGILYYRDTKHRGEDIHLQHTARRAAELDAVQSGCVVNGCPGGEGCRHTGGGLDMGYFDHLTNTIIDDLPIGYNSYHTMKVDGETYEGKPGTMVIRVRYDGEKVMLDWVEGKSPWLPETETTE
jgi:hypothetical protein